MLALLRGAPFHGLWAGSLIFIPLPVMLVFAVFRGSSARFRWWAFQYLGVCAIAFSAALCGVLLSLLLDNVLAGRLSLLLFVLFYGFALYAAHRIHVTPLEIITPKIAEPQRLVQISDVHIGSRPASYLEKVLALVDAQKPDMLLITGDLIDENVPAEALEPLAGLAYPVFYCSGNHERYIDYQKALDILTDLGVTVLSDAATIKDDIHILGVEDRQHVMQAQDALNSLCASTQSSATGFRVLLYHQPDLWSSAIHHGIDLMLSGHTHKGQIWPFGYLVRTRYAHVAGHFRTALNHLFVSQGTGTWGPTLRFGTRCEMTVIELKPEKH